MSTGAKCLVTGLVWLYDDLSPRRLSAFTRLDDSVTVHPAFYPKCVGAQPLWGSSPPSITLVSYMYSTVSSPLPNSPPHTCIPIICHFYRTTCTNMHTQPNACVCSPQVGPHTVYVIWTISVGPTLTPIYKVAM